MMIFQRFMTNGLVPFYSRYLVKEQKGMLNTDQGVVRVWQGNMVGVKGKLDLLYGTVNMHLKVERNVLMEYVGHARQITMKMATGAQYVKRALQTIARKPMQVICPASDQNGMDQAQQIVPSVT